MVTAQGVGNRAHLLGLEVGCDLERQRDIAAVLFGERLLARLDRPQQRVEFGVALQLTQVLVLGEEMFTAT